MDKLPNHTALKEWSSVVASLGRGDQILLIRKGGIADAKFGIEAERFYLYPTYFHQGESEARATATITHWCEVVRTWRVHDLELLRRLESLVAMPWDTLETRYRFRADQALFVIAVRTWELATPVDVPHREHYSGCVSWISVDDEVGTAGSTPVLPEEELLGRIAEVEALLAPAA